MSRWLALAAKAGKEMHTSTRHLTKPDKTPSVQSEVGFSQVLSECQVDVEIKSASTKTDDFKHGFACNGYPKTWTGKIVSLEAWRQLSEWDKHGPDGRLFYGKTKRWETQPNLENQTSIHCDSPVF